jgi:hypothetical protein
MLGYNAEKDSNTYTSEESLLTSTTLFLRFLEVLGLLKEPFNMNTNIKIINIPGSVVRTQLLIYQPIQHIKNDLMIFKKEDERFNVRFTPV